MGNQRILRTETRRLSYLLSKPKRQLSSKEMKELNELLAQQQRQ